MNRVQRAFAAAAVLLTLACVLYGAAGQQQASGAAEPEGDPVFRSDSQLVVLHATVLDQDQHFVTNLPESAFAVFEDGTRQSVKIFRQEDVPVSIGIILDNSASMRDKVERVHEAAMEFVTASHKQDEMFLLSFTYELTMESDFTSKVDQLRAAMEKVLPRGGTALYDAVVRGLTHLDKKGGMQKKVLFVVSDGEDTGSTATLEEVMRLVERSGSLVYTIGILGSEDPQSARRAKRALEKMAKAGGGEAYFPESLDEIRVLTKRIAADIRNQYVLGYTPMDEARPGYRKIDVKLTSANSKRLTVRHRPGYTIP